MQHPPSGVDANSWNYSISSLINAVANWPISSRSIVPTARVKSVADYLDQTNGADLGSLVGVMRLATRIEDICPADNLNGALVTLRQMQVDGQFPIPPEEAGRKYPYLKR